MSVSPRRQSTIDAYVRECTSSNIEPCEEVIVALTNNDRELQVASREQPLTDADLACLANGVLVNPHSLRCLSLEDNAFSIDGVMFLIDAIETNPNIVREIRFGRNRLLDACVVAVANRLMHSNGGTVSFHRASSNSPRNNSIGSPNRNTGSSGVGIKILDFSENGVTNHGCVALCQVLADQSSELVEVSFHNNALDENAALSLANAIRNSPKLKHLHLGYNQLKDAGATQLARCIPIAPLLSTLDLTANRIGPQGGQELAWALLFDKINSESSVGRHSPRTQSSSNAAVNLSRLQRLNLRSNDFDDRTLRLFADVIVHNTTLTQLSLGFMEASEETTTIILEAIVEGTIRRETSALALLDLYAWPMNLEICEPIIAQIMLGGTSTNGQQAGNRSSGSAGVERGGQSPASSSSRSPRNSSSPHASSGIGHVANAKRPTTIRAITSDACQPIFHAIDKHNSERQEKALHDIYIGPDDRHSAIAADSAPVASPNDKSPYDRSSGVISGDESPNAGIKGEKKQHQEVSPISRANAVLTVPIPIPEGINNSAVNSNHPNRSPQSSNSARKTPSPSSPPSASPNVTKGSAVVDRQDPTQALFPTVAHSPAAKAPADRRVRASPSAAGVGTPQRAGSVVTAETDNDLHSHLLLTLSQLQMRSEVQEAIHNQRVKLLEERIARLEEGETRQERSRSRGESQSQQHREQIEKNEALLQSQLHVIDRIEGEVERLTQRIHEVEERERVVVESFADQKADEEERWEQQEARHETFANAFDTLERRITVLSEQRAEDTELIALLEHRVAELANLLSESHVEIQRLNKVAVDLAARKECVCDPANACRKNNNESQRTDNRHAREEEMNTSPRDGMVNQNQKAKASSPSEPLGEHNSNTAVRRDQMPNNSNNKSGGIAPLKNKSEPTSSEFVSESNPHPPLQQPSRGGRDAHDPRRPPQHQGGLPPPLSLAQTRRMGTAEGGGVGAGRPTRESAVSTNDSASNAARSFRDNSDSPVPVPAPAQLLSNESPVLINTRGGDKFGDGRPYDAPHRAQDLGETSQVATEDDEDGEEDDYTYRGHNERSAKFTVVHSPKAGETQQQEKRRNTSNSSHNDRNYTAATFAKITEKERKGRGRGDAGFDMASPDPNRPSFYTKKEDLLNQPSGGYAMPKSRGGVENNNKGKENRRRKNRGKMSDREGDSQSSSYSSSGNAPFGEEGDGLNERSRESKGEPINNMEGTQRVDHQPGNANTSGYEIPQQRHNNNNNNNAFRGSNHLYPYQSTKTPSNARIASVSAGGTITVRPGHITPHRGPGTNRPATDFRDPYQDADQFYGNPTGRRRSVSPSRVTNEHPLTVPTIFVRDGKVDRCYQPNEPTPLDDTCPSPSLQTSFYPAPNAPGLSASQPSARPGVLPRRKVPRSTSFAMEPYAV